MLSLSNIPFIGKYLGTTPAQELYQTVTKKSCLIPKQASPLLSGLSQGSVYMITDITATYRASFDVAGLLVDQFPNISFGLFHTILKQEGILPGYHSFGLGTALNAILGIVGMKHDLAQINRSQNIGDRFEVLKSRVSLVKDTFYASTGVIFGTFRPLAILASIRKEAISGFNAPTLLGRVAFGFVFVGILVYAVCFLLSMIVQGLSIWEISGLKDKLNKANSVKEKLEILQRKLYVDSNKVRSKLLQEYQKLAGGKSGEQSLQKMLTNEGLRAGKETIKELLKQVNIPLPNEEKLEAILKSILSFNRKDVHKQLADLGLQVCIGKTAAKKQAKIQRILGDKTFTEICKTNTQTSLHSLINRIGKGNATALEKGKEITAQMKKAMASNIRLNSAIIGYDLIGIGTMIIAVVLTGGVGLIISSIAMLAFNILSLGIDGYFFKQSFQGETPAAYDKKLLIVSTILCLISFFSVVALSATGVISMGIIPVAIMLVLSALWLGQNGVTWSALNRLEKEEKIKHPTLENILKALQKKEAKELLDQMLANLSPELKKMLDKELSNIVKKQKEFTSEQMQQVTLNVIKRVEDIKKEKMEKLRQTLQPHLLKAAM